MEDVLTVAQIAALIATLTAPCPRCHHDARAEDFYAASISHNVEADLLAHWAFYESSLSSRSIGKLGEVGLFQVHGEHRKACEDAGRDPLSVDCGAWLIARDAEHCGSLERGLNRYASGSCNGTPRSIRIVKYRLSVLKRWRKK
jgi:hypothetical protein